jgi:cyclopropane-fatty-acyl-phospholipid synthase
MRGIDALFARFESSLPCAFRVRSAAGEWTFGPGEPAFAVTVRNARGERALRSLDELWICEAYVRGDLELEGDVVRATWLRSAFSDGHWWIKAWRRLQPLLLGRERLNPQWIAKHYDADNLQLFAVDRDYRAYTPGIYEGGRDDDLEGSTRRKYDFAWEQLRLRSGEEVLDVGHGWGGFLQYCCERGARPTGITLSRHQLEFVIALIAERGLDAVASYQDFFTYRPGKRFAGITVMGVIEDLADYPRVLAHLAELLAPGGRAYFDFAAAKEPVGTSSFVTKYVWPGLFRPVYMEELMAAIDRSPFELVGVWNDRRNYYLWARNGHQRWLDHREAVVRRAGEETWRLFRLLFAGTAGAMSDPAYHGAAYRMVLELPPDRHQWRAGRRLG